jgi:hypothetical protein
MGYVAAMVSVCYRIRLLVAMVINNSVKSSYPPRFVILSVSVSIIAILLVVGGWAGLSLGWALPSTSWAGLVFLLGVIVVTSGTFLLSCFTRYGKILSPVEFRGLSRVTFSVTPFTVIKAGAHRWLLWDSGWLELLGPKYAQLLVSFVVSETTTWRSYRTKLVSSIIVVGLLGLYIFEYNYSLIRCTCVKGSTDLQVVESVLGYTWYSQYGKT